jgi:branched-chain amino acid transport system permease protein
MLPQQLVNGMMLGSTYALVAIGYTLIFGVLRLLHLAHGEVFMVGAFAGLQLVLLWHFGPLGALIGGLLGSALLGMLLELVAFRPIRRHGNAHLAPIVSTLGAGLVIQELMTKFFGAEQSSFPSSLHSVVYDLGFIAVTGTQLFIVGAAAMSMIVLHQFVTRTRYGMALRAASESIEIASILGINVDTVILLTFAVASALAGIAGVLVGLNFSAISPYMGIDMGIKGMAVMLIGGLGSLYGAMLGGLILGMGEVLSVAYLESAYRDAFTFGLMILILIVRPGGLFRTALRAER